MRANMTGSPGLSQVNNCRPLRLRSAPKVVVEPNIYRSVTMMTPDLRDAIRTLIEGNAPWPLLLTGGVGAGKTCAALCVADYAAGVRYFTVESACEELIEVQQGRRDDGFCTMTPAAWWRRNAEVELGVLDELGSRERVTDHHYNLVKRFIDMRHGRPLICITNLPLASVRGPSIQSIYDDRVASRLAAGTVIQVAGDDRRLRR